jgi:sugar phosphate isomerase/epimerase
MRIGLSSYAYRYATAPTKAPPPAQPGLQLHPLDARGVLARAARLGFDLVQFCDNLPLDALADEQLDDVLDLAAETGVAVEVGTRGLDPDHLTRYIDLAQRVGSPRLRLVCDSDDPDVIVQRLGDLVPRLHRAGVALAIENHFDLPGEALVAILQRIDDEAVGICLDTANSIGLVEPPLVTVRALAPYALQVHLKDYAVDKAEIGYHVTGRPLGAGWLDIPAVLDLLREAGRADLDYMVELWMDPAADLEATLNKEEAWIAESIQAARRYLAGDGD